LIGILNIFALTPQLIQILRTRKVEGISLTMFMIFLIIQGVFALNGFFHRDKAQMVTMGLSTVITVIIIISIIMIRQAL